MFLLQEIRNLEEARVRLHKVRCASCFFLCLCVLMSCIVPIAGASCLERTHGRHMERLFESQSDEYANSQRELYARLAALEGALAFYDGGTYCVLCSAVLCECGVVLCCVFMRP